ncbi:DNA-directed RNA polymerase subunit beta [Bienertia sinuspersici]
MLRDGNEGMSTIPGLNQIQFEGFYRFIDQGLTKELYKFSKKLKIQTKKLNFNYLWKHINWPNP